MRQFHNGKWDGESVFVFGSNLVGRHGAGAAKYAVDHCGAIYGQGWGMQGNSYAIPTKDKYIKTLPLEDIKEWVNDFLIEAKLCYYPDTRFFVTALGTGLAGYKHEDIAPMFKNAPDNCILPIEWKGYVE